MKSSLFFVLLLLLTSVFPRELPRPGGELVPAVLVLFCDLGHERVLCDATSEINFKSKSIELLKAPRHVPAQHHDIIESIKLSIKLKLNIYLRSISGYAYWGLAPEEEQGPSSAAPKC